MTNTPRPSRNDRREEAREAARIARDKAQKRQALMKWLVPTVASIAILAIVGGVIWAVIAFQPAPKAEAGPANMVSDGFVLETQDGEIGFVQTPAVQKDSNPVPTEAREGVLNIVTLVDYKCPHCQEFEGAYGPTLNALVKEGAATLEIRPVSIMGPGAVRAANVAACIAENAPEKFLDVHYALFEDLSISSNNGYVDLIRAAGVSNEAAETCIRDETFTPWVETATARSGVRGTPTVIVNGTQWDMQAEQFTDFITAELAKLNS